MANLNGQIETEFEMKCSPEKFYNFWKTPQHVPKAAGDHIHGVDMHDGDWDSHDHGSIKIWKYTTGKLSQCS